MLPVKERVKVAAKAEWRANEALKGVTWQVKARMTESAVYSEVGTCTGRAVRKGTRMEGVE